MWIQSGGRLRYPPNPSIIRRGNHFVWIDGKWALIDGPWFKRLEAFRGDSWMPIRIHYPAPLEPIALECFLNGPYKWQAEEVEWEPMMWHPGVLMSPYAVRLPAFNSARWNEVLTKRKRVGYVTLPDGKLPALFSRLEFPEDEDWANMLMREGE